MSDSVGKPLGNYVAKRTHSVNIIASTGQRFLLSKTVVSERARHERAVSGRPWSEARAPAPPPSDKPGATPPGDAYAPLGAAAPVHRKHPRHPGPSSPATAAPARQALNHYALHLRKISQLQRAVQKISNFRLLKKARVQANHCETLAAAQIPNRTMEQTNANPF